MSDTQSAKLKDGMLYRVFRCFGREFPVYYQYSDEDGNAIPNYPDFETKPQYTGEGRPFVTVSQESCPCFQPDTPEGALGGECGSCRYFRGEEGFSLFGVCMNDKRREPKKETESKR